jgi:hypothetical protein
MTPTWHPQREGDQKTEALEKPQDWLLDMLLKVMTWPYHLTLFVKYFAGVKCTENTFTGRGACSRLNLEYIWAARRHVIATPSTQNSSVVSYVSCTSLANMNPNWQATG